MQCWVDRKALWQKVSITLCVSRTVDLREYDWDHLLNADVRLVDCKIRLVGMYKTGNLILDANGCEDEMLKKVSIL